MGFHIVCEMRSLASQFQGFQLVHANRTANSAAHSVAKVALICNDTTDYHVILGFLIDLIQSEKLLPE